MKVAIVSDTHFGYKKGNETFLNSQLRFFREQFIPELKAAGIDTILHLGDFFDNRVHINSKILNSVIDLLSNDFKDFKIIILVGNHDSYFESTIDVNSIEPLSLIPNVSIVKKISQIELGGRNITLVPWITKSEDAVKELEKYSGELCMGHLELTSFDMFRNRVCEHGTSFEHFANNYKLTFSGHFHTRSEKEFPNGNKIVYMGNPFHLTRNDIGDDRGYCILDLDTLEYEYVSNHISLRFITVNFPKKVTREEIEGNNVDVYVDYQTCSVEDIHTYIKEIESYQPAFLPVQIKSVNMMSYTTTDDIQIGTVTDLMNEYVDALTLDNKDRLKNLLMSLYEDCRSEI